MQYATDSYFVYVLEMEYGWQNFLAQSFISYTYIHHKDFFEIRPCAKKVIFVTEFVILCKNP